MAKNLHPIGCLFHWGFCVYYLIVTYFDLQIYTPGVLEFGWRWKYLTFLNLVLQVSYFVLASLIDVIAVLRGQDSKSLLNIRDGFFASFVFPYGFFVACSFWGIYAVNRELIFPKFLDNIIPNWINHALHTWCGVSVFLEAVVNRHDYPRNRVGAPLTLAFGLTYMAWLFYIALNHNFWVYPFLRVMENSARVTFFCICASILALFYFIGKWLTLAIWKGDLEESNETTQKRKEVRKTKVKKMD